MIPRYTRPEMAAIGRGIALRIWYEIEAMPPTRWRSSASYRPRRRRIRARRQCHIRSAPDRRNEREVRHDVIAFLTHLGEIVGPDARYIHQGMTSSDVLDTCLNVQLARAADILDADLAALLAALKRRALEHKTTPCIGRSHGIHAEPTTFGLKLAFAFAEFERAKVRLAAARKDVATCAISGAVGRSPTSILASSACRVRYGLSVEPVSTQIIPRDGMPCISPRWQSSQAR